MLYIETKQRQNEVLHSFNAFQKVNW